MSSPFSKLFPAFLLLMVLPSQIQAETDTTNYFARYPMPDSLSRYDAVTMMDHTSLVYNVENFKSFPYVMTLTYIVKKLIRFNTERGLKEHGFISITKNNFTEIVRLKATIIKPDGRTLEKTPQQQEVIEGSDGRQFRYGHINVIIPGLETGDMLLLDFRIRQPVSGGSAQESFFRESIPVLNSEFSLRFAEKLSFELKTYNGLTHPDCSTEFGDSILLFQNAFIPPLIGSGLYQPYYDLPYLRYVIRSEIEAKTFGGPVVIKGPTSWSFYFDSYVKSLYHDHPEIKMTSYFQELIHRELRNLQNATKLDQFKKFNRYILDSVQIKDFKKNREFSSGWYLYSKEINRKYLYILYRELMDYFGFETYFVLAREKSEGPIDPDLVCDNVATESLLAFRDESGELHFIIPKYSNMALEPDELPSNLRGTMAFLIPVKNPSAYSLVPLPTYGAEINCRSREYTVSVLPEENKAMIRCSITYTGSRSTSDKIIEQNAGADSVKAAYTRKLQAENVNYTNDSILLGKSEVDFPFKRKEYFCGSQTGIIQKLGDSLYSVDLLRWLNPDYIESPMASQNITLRTYYANTDKSILNISFPSGATILNKEKLEVNVVNDIGSYRMQCRQTGENSIQVESQYVIEQSIIPPSGYGMLIGINKGMQMTKDAKLFVRLNNK